MFLVASRLVWRRSAVQCNFIRRRSFGRILSCDENFLFGVRRSGPSEQWKLMYPRFSHDEKFRVEIKENIYTVPNLLSLLRIAVSPVLGYLILQESYTLSLVLFAAAGITDLVDGLIARVFPSQASNFGTVLDPLADKCLMGCLCVALTASGLLPLGLTVLFIGRDLSLIVMSFYLRYITLPKPKTWQRFWDIKTTSVKAVPSTLGKLNTGLQLALIGATMCAPVFHFVDHPLLHVMCYVTGVTTVASGLSYIVMRNGFTNIDYKAPRSKT